MNKFLVLTSLIIFGFTLNGCAWRAGVLDDRANAAEAKNKPVIKTDAKALKTVSEKPVNTIGSGMTNN